MKRHSTKIVLIIMILSALLFAEAMRRFVHSTGMTSFRVDDFMPASFVEHNYGGEDYLWRGFIAFALDSNYILHGRGADSEGLFVSHNFEFGDSLIFARTDDGGTVYFYSDSIYVNTDVSYYGDTAISRVETVYVSVIGEDRYRVEFDPTITLMYSIGSDTSWSNTEENDSENFEATAYRRMSSGIVREDYFEYVTDTVYFTYNFNVYANAAGDTFYVPPDTLPSDDTTVTLIGTEAAYTKQIWAHVSEDDTSHLFVPPDTLPISDTALANLVIDTMSVEIMQYRYEDTLTGIEYVVPPSNIDTSADNFVLVDSVLIAGLTVKETLYVGAKTENAFGDLSNGIYIKQTFDSDYAPDSLDSIFHIPCNITLYNIGETALKDSRLMLFYDADFTTVYPLMNDDMANFEYDKRAIYMHDYFDFDGLHMGFAFQDLDTVAFEDDSIYFGAHSMWYSNGREFSDLKNLIFHPSFDYYPLDTVGTDSMGFVIDTNYSDLGIYAVILIPDVFPDESLSIDLAFIAGEYDNFIGAVNEFRGTEDMIDEPNVIPVSRPEALNIIAYPNPFNSSLSIDIPEYTNVRIIDIHGRERAIFEARPYAQTRRWQPNDLPSGVYLIVPDNHSIEPTKVILVK